MKDKQLDEMLKLDDEKVNINKKIKKSIHKKIYSRIIIFAVIVSLAIVAVIKGYAYISQQIYYNPFNEENLIVEKQGQISSDATFQIVLQTWCEIFSPGYGYYPSHNIQSLGFGNYELKAKFQNLFDHLYIDGSYNASIIINQSKMTIEDFNNEHYLSRVSYEFLNPSLSKKDTYGKDLFKISDWTLKEIEKLPESSLLNVSISFEKPYSLEKTIDFMKQYNQVVFLWMATDLWDKNDSSIANGISLFKISMYDFNEQAKKEYPYFYIENKDSLTPDILQQYYLSNIKMILDHEKEFNMISQTTHFMNYDSLKETYKRAQNGFNIAGLRIVINKNDLLKMIKKDNIQYIYIDDVKLSQLQK